MTTAPFAASGNSLAGRGVAFDAASLVASDRPGADERGKRLAEIAEVAYRQGRDSATLSWDDRFDVTCAVDALRALAVIVGPTPTGDRYRRCSDILARLLHDQQQAGS